MSVTKIETHQELRTKMAEILMSLDDADASLKRAEVAVKVARTMILSSDSETRTMKTQHSIGAVPEVFGNTRIAGAQ